MPDPNESLAFFRTVQAKRATTREAIQMALLFAAQVVISCSLLMWGYERFRATGVIWAIVSAVLVVQPGIEQALSASAIRIAANAVGGLTGFLIGQFFGLGAVQMLAEILRRALGWRASPPRARHLLE